MARIRLLLMASLVGASMTGATCNKQTTESPQKPSAPAPNAPDSDQPEDDPTGGTGPVVQAPEITEVPGISADDLPGPVRLDFWRIMNETFCYCGCPRTLAACLANRAECSCTQCSESMANYILGLYREGYTTEEVDFTVLEGFAEGYNGALQKFDTKDHPGMGTDGAGFTLVEFADFGCSHCKAVFPVLKKLVAKRKDVKLYYFYFPLGDPEGPSQLAAEAAEEARVQGKFWEMAEALFDNQPVFDETALIKYGAAAGLDVQKLKSALETRKHKERVLSDKKTGQGANIESTPTIFINGRRFGLPRNLSNFEYRLSIEGERGTCK